MVRFVFVFYLQAFPDLGEEQQSSPALAGGHILMGSQSSQALPACWTGAPFCLGLE